MTAFPGEGSVPLVKPPPAPHLGCATNSLSPSSCFSWAQVRCRSCPGCVLGYTCPVACGGCLWTPGCYYGLDCCVGLCFCTCRDEATPGTFFCRDLKGNTMSLVKADAERGTLALFSENEFAGSRGDALEVSCYCEK